MNRIIYVVPFTSIIDQNADVLRRVTAPLREINIPDPVIEHHSNLDPQSETTTSRLASENWDAPLILTTGVQFYESLYANRSSRCRKLHNIANAVVILDEAQTIPVDLLHPCLKALHELQANYHTTVVLCTATQPAIHHRDDFSIGLKLHPDHGGTASLFRRLQTAYEQLVNWADDPVFTTRRGFPDKWFYDGYTNRWTQPTPIPKVV